MQNLTRYCCAMMLLLAMNASASVVLTGTRIIFPSSAKEKTLQFTNTDAVPYLMQVTIAKSEKRDQADNENQITPFITSPAIFRIEPHAGQSVRLGWTGGQLPADRESVFYLTFHQIPASHKTESDKNKLVLAVSSQVKLFYRPAALRDTSDNAVQHLVVRISNRQIILDNPTGYYITIKNITLSTENNASALAERIMVAPKSTLTLPENNRHSLRKGQRIKIITINDFGSESLSETELN